MKVEIFQAGDERIPSLGGYKNQRNGGWWCGEVIELSCVLMMKALVAQACPTLGDPMDCSPPGFTVHGILQAKILAQVAIPFSRGSSHPGIKLWSPHCRQIFYCLSNSGGG